MSEEEEFQKKLHAAFMVEADEHLQTISSLLLDLERNPGAEQLPGMIETIYREAHSLKGAARSVNRGDVETICQKLETVFASWKTNGLDSSPQTFDSVSRTIGGLAAILVSPGADAPRATSRQLISRAEAAVPAAESGGTIMAAAQKAVVHETRIAPAPQQSGEHERAGGATIRIAAERLDSLVRQAEEMLGLKLSVGQRAVDLRDLSHSLEAWEREWTKTSRNIRAFRRAVERASEPSEHTSPEHAPLRDAHSDNAPAASLLEFLEWNHAFMKKLQARLWTLTKTADQERRTTAGMVDSLLAGSKRLIMLPFATVLGIFPKLVRDLSHDLGKDVDLTMAGGDIEIDKRILEEMKDPLLHLVRNALDHGIEPPSVRRALNKPERASLKITIEQIEANKVEIVIADDGRGIDPAEIRAAALKSGAVTAPAAARLDDEESLALIFRSGLSTSPIITEISGRGLGMAIVREKVDKLGGSVVIESKVRAGAIFRIRLPLTLATFKGLVVAASGATFVIPASSVERIVRAGRDTITTIENRETIPYDEKPLALARLTDVLGLLPEKERPSQLSIVIVKVGAERIGFDAASILGEQEVLVKPLGEPLRRVRNVAGAAILASGKPAPILNPVDLIESAKRLAGAPRLEAAAEPEAAPNRSVLVAEDSITSRMLLKNILESAGYNVTTSVDGIDALTALKSGDFAAIVSDVDMPRMNGFDLTARIRADARTAGLPVVLVTARESREDRERGIDVGANAYLVKSSFDQSNLLEVLGRLV